ncbi:MAG: hypothetical protein KGH76_05955, partial [Thaumarchaeota archaeon]|nr:hypothetical protein [Nitrososphaerota archaeon]
MTNTKLLLAFALPAIALLAAVPTIQAFADGNGSTGQSFNTGTMNGYSSSIPGSAYTPATASLNGQIITKSDGTSNLSPLSGTITVGDQTGTVQLKPTGAITSSSYSDWYCGTTTQNIQLG